MSLSKYDALEIAQKIKNAYVEIRNSGPLKSWPLNSIATYTIKFFTHWFGRMALNKYHNRLFVGIP